MDCIRNLFLFIWFLYSIVLRATDSDGNVMKKKNVSP